MVRITAGPVVSESEELRLEYSLQGSIDQSQKKKHKGTEVTGLRI